MYGLISEIRVTINVLSAKLPFIYMFCQVSPTEALLGFTGKYFFATGGW